MTLWVIFAGLLIAALGFIIWPVFRGSGRMTPLIGVLIVAFVALSAGLYQQIGSPGVPSGAAEQPDVSEVVAALAARLEENPEDVDGWLLLAQSYQTLEDYDNAGMAYEKVLEIAPMHPTALFFGGYVAAGRGEYELAAARWEAILEMGAAPDDVAESIERQIAAWRGDSAPSIDSVPAEQSGDIVTARITLSDEAAANVPVGATVFVFARDPQQPSPPIAVARRPLESEPLTVGLGDKDAMVPGRTLSAHASFELMARVSVSGNPIAQPGDWYGGLQYNVGDDANVDIVIDTPVE